MAAKRASAARRARRIRDSRCRQSKPLCAKPICRFPIWIFSLSPPGRGVSAACVWDAESRKGSLMRRKNPSSPFLLWRRLRRLLSRARAASSPLCPPTASMFIWRRLFGNRKANGGRFSRRKQSPSRNLPRSRSPTRPTKTRNPAPLAVGAGFARYPALASSLGARVADADAGGFAAQPDIAAVAALARILFARGETVAAIAAAPVYARDKVALETAERLALTAA